MGYSTLHEQFEELRERVRGEMARWHVPGVAVGMLRDGQRETLGLGVASLETAFPVRPDTLFQIGSISKVYTATLVMTLVDAGMLALDTPVVEYLPDLPLADESARQALTLRHLLTHTGGFYGDYFDDFGLGDDALARCVASFSTLAQMTPPGALWTYCNAGFYLAGRVVEQVLGVPFEQAMRERIFEPLGLAHSFYFAHDAISYPAAAGHTQKMPGSDEHEIARLYRLPRNVAAAGGIISNVDDLLTFAEFHMGDGAVNGNGRRVLSEDSLRQMQTPQVKAANFAEAYGLGWAMRELAGVRIVEHGGSTNGFEAKLLVVPERRFALAMLSNSSRGGTLIANVADWALDAYLGLQKREPQQIELPAERQATFAGTYSRPDGIITIAVEGGGLRREMHLRDLLTGDEQDYPPNLLMPIADLEFVVVTQDENEGSLVDFIPDASGQVRYLRAGGRLAERVEPTDWTEQSMESGA